MLWVVLRAGSEAAFPIDTFVVVPLKLIAFLIFPKLVQVTPVPAPSWVRPPLPELHVSFVPPAQVLSAPSSSFQYPTAEPTGLPPSGCPPFISSVICPADR